MTIKKVKKKGRFRYSVGKERESLANLIVFSARRKKDLPSRETTHLLIIKREKEGEKQVVVLA